MCSVQERCNQNLKRGKELQPKDRRDTNSGYFSTARRGLQDSALPSSSSSVPLSQLPCRSTAPSVFSSRSTLGQLGVTNQASPPQIPQNLLFCGKQTHAPCSGVEGSGMPWVSCSHRLAALRLFQGNPKTANTVMKTLQNQNGSPGAASDGGKPHESLSAGQHHHH